MRHSDSYIVGLLIEMVIVSTMNSLALIIIGVKYAILPYIGGFVAILLPVLIAIVTKDGYTAPIAIIISYLAIQYSGLKRM